jgi:hypothetical protein
MALPSTLLDLALVLRTEPAALPPAHVATLAARLGYRSVWLPVQADDLGAAAELDALAAATAVQIGVVLSGSDDDVARWFAGVAISRPGLLVNVSGARATLPAAIGVEVWRRQVFTAEFDPDAAGCVVRAGSRAAALVAVRGAVASGAAEGSVGVGLEVSIGRTMSEAVARAERDPLVDARHLRSAGLFGTFEDAQEQALDLAAAGAGWILADLAAERDVADLLAQLRAAVAGPTAVLHARRR